MSLLYRIPDYTENAASLMRGTSDSTNAMTKTTTRETTGPGKSAGGALSNAAGGAYAGAQMGSLWDSSKNAKTTNTKMGAPKQTGQKAASTSGSKWGAGIGTVLGLLSYIL